MKRKTNLTVSIGLILLGIAILVLWGCEPMAGWQGKTLLVIDKQGNEVFAAFVRSDGKIMSTSKNEYSFLVDNNAEALFTYTNKKGWKIK